MGKSVYFTDLQIEMIQNAFTPGNFAFEGRDEEEEIKRQEAAAEILRKVSK
jgi:hypothetical protein